MAEQREAQVTITITWPTGKYGNLQHQLTFTAATPAKALAKAKSCLDHLALSQEVFSALTVV